MNPRDAFFYLDHGTFLTFHVDPDLELPLFSEHLSYVPFMQADACWDAVEGRGFPVYKEVSWTAVDANTGELLK